MRRAASVPRSVGQDAVVRIPRGGRFASLRLGRRGQSPPPGRLRPISSKRRKPCWNGSRNAVWSASSSEGESWHAGVIGIVAARLVEKYGRPTVVLAIDGGRKPRARAEAWQVFSPARGRVRLRAAADFCFGGHPMAAGVSLKAADVPPPSPGDQRLRPQPAGRHALSRGDNRLQAQSRGPSTDLVRQIALLGALRLRATPRPCSAFTA